MGISIYIQFYNNFPQKKKVINKTSFLRVEDSFEN